MLSEAHKAVCACTRVHLCSVRHTRLYVHAPECISFVFIDKEHKGQEMG